MGNRFPSPEKHVKFGSSNRLLYAFCEMQGYRAEMEDGHTIAPTIEGDDTRAFFGIYDGHSGNGTSEIAGQHLLQYVLEEMKKRKKSKSPEEDMRDGGDCSHDGDKGDDMWKTAFLAFDTELRKLEKTYLDSAMYAYDMDSDSYMSDKDDEGDKQNDEKDSAATNGDAAVTETPKFAEGLNEEQARELARRVGGSTAVTVYMQRTPQDDGWEMTCANLGDSRAVLSHRNKVIPLSEDHKPSNPEERQRIENAGGFVSADRVDGNLALSRAFGDFVYKDEKLQAHETKVIAIPDVKRRIVKDDDILPVSYLVVACDGIWDVFQNEVLDLRIRQYMHEIDLFNPDTPIPEKFLRPGRIMWIDKLVPDWNEEDLSAWIDTNQLGIRGDWILHRFFESAHKEGEFSERVFDDVIAEASITSPNRAPSYQEMKQILLDRIRLQEAALNNAPQPSTTPESKLSLIAKKIVDDAVFVLRSMDNISLSIIILRHPDHSTETRVAPTEDVAMDTNGNNGGTPTQ